MTEKELQIRLEIFEGPLDLLLHLVRVNEYDIFDIPVSEITKQFNEYLDLMRELNLNIAAEYLVMSATLMRVKSRLLLPPEENEDGEEEDPRTELVQQLLEYQRFREAALEIGERPLLGRDVFARKFPSPELADLQVDTGYLEVDIYQLLQALRDVIKHLPKDATHLVRMSGMSLRERMASLLERLRRSPSMLFTEFFQDVATVADVVITFLGMLELVRQSMIKITQIDTLGPIRIVSLLSDEEEDQSGN